MFYYCATLSSPKKRRTVIFTSQNIPGQTIDNFMKTSLRPFDFQPANSYTRASQLTRLTELFGSSTTAEEYLNKTYLARGHLSPNGDMIFVSWQYTHTITSMSFHNGKQ